MMWLAIGLALACAILTWRYRMAVIQANDVTQGLQSLGNHREVWPIISRMDGIWTRQAETFNTIASELQAHITALELDRQQLRAVLGGMVEGVIVIDGNRRLRYANPSAQRLFALDSQAVGRLVPELIRSPSIQQAMEGTLASGLPYRGEIALNANTVEGNANANPRLQPRALQVQGTRLPGPPPEVVLVYHDITDLRRLERMRQDFVANVSHELKTPLAAIKAYTETLLDWALHDDQVNERFLHQIDEQADRLHSLIQDMLSLARFESGQEIFNHRPLAILPFLQERIAVHRTRALSKNLNLTLAFTPAPATNSNSNSSRPKVRDDNLTIQVDEEAMRQIVDNLIDNAIKYTTRPDGFVHVQCKSEASWVILEVGDNGPGIPREEQSRIFERFYRVDKGRSREVGGTGLGLSIVKHLVQALGGAIEVHSRPGAGSRFLVRLPRAAVRPANGLATSNSETITIANGNGNGNGNTAEDRETDGPALAAQSPRD